MPVLRRTASAVALSFPLRPRRAAPVAFAAAVLSACATTTVDRSLARVDELARPHANTAAHLLRSNDERTRAAADVDGLLGAPLTAEAAVRIAFAHSPALQALLADHAVATAGAIQQARPGNPHLTLERLVRGDITEIGRLLTVGVSDLVSLPARGRIADAAIEAQTLRSATHVVRLAFDVRQAWVTAVAAWQAAQYAADVRLAAAASDDLARRMLEAGNFSRLQRAREQAFLAEALVQQVRADLAAVAARERLVRLLGLNRERAERLRLPERLPDIPAAGRGETEVRAAVFDTRLDVRIARHEVDRTARAFGLTRVTSWIDGVSLGVARNSESGEPVQRGWELELPLPVFDLGDAARAGAEAAWLGAVNRAAQTAVDAQSQVHEAYRHYAGAFDLARHYRDEIVPLRQAIAEENTLRYNGMLIGVFELLADARERVASVMAALDAQRDFWLADTALDAALTGLPLDPAPVSPAPARSAAAGATGAH